MLHGSETWPVRNENGRRMCDVKVKDRVPSKELREAVFEYCGKTGCVGMGLCCKKEDNEWVKMYGV